MSRENVCTSAYNKDFINVHTKSHGFQFRDIEVLGCFSMDSDRNFHPDLSQLRYLKVRDFHGQVHFDLNTRLSDVLRKDETDEKLDNLLKWIMNDKRVWKSIGTTPVAECERTPVDFVSYRGLLSRILSTPYENFDGWIICASQWKGTIYLCAKETAEHQQKRAKETDDMKKFLLWGRKFEQFVLADTVDGKPDADRPVNENEELCVIYGSKVNGHNLLYGAEVDGVDSDREICSHEDLKGATFVEVKTHRTLENRGHEISFRRHKLRSVWCQVAPVDINCVLFGHRCDKGIVRYLTRYKLEQILEESINWKFKHCLAFLNTFLENVKQRAQQDLPENSPDSVIKFEWKVGDSKVRSDVIIGQSEYSFLPRWYTDVFKDSVQVI